MALTSIPVAMTLKYILYFFVRDIERKVFSYVIQLMRCYKKNGIYRGNRPKVNASLRTIKAMKIQTIVTDLIKSSKAEVNIFIYGEDE